MKKKLFIIGMLFSIVLISGCCSCNEEKKQQEPLKLMKAAGGMNIWQYEERHLYCFQPVNLEIDNKPIDVEKLCFFTEGATIREPTINYYEYVKRP
jgi:hypothetical protein